MTKTKQRFNSIEALLHSKQSKQAVARFKRRMAPPVFADPEKTRIARLTQVMIEVSFMVIILLDLVTLLDVSSPLSQWLLKICTWIGLLLIVAFLMLRYGFVNLANRMLNVGVVVSFTYEAAFIDNGIFSVGYGLLYLAIIHAGIVLGRRAAFLNAVIGIVIGIALEYGRAIGYLAPVAILPSNYFRLTAFGGGLTIAATLIYMATEGLNQAISSLRQNETMQAETTRKLQYEISERRAREREQVAVLTMASAMRGAATYAEIVPIILKTTVEIFAGAGAALSRFTGNNNEQVFEFALGQWEDWAEAKLASFPTWEKSQLGNCTVYINNAVDGDHNFPLRAKLHQLPAVATVVLEGTELQIGALWLGCQQPITSQDLRILASIGNMVANALQRIQLHTEARNRAEQLGEINRLGQFIAETLDLAQIYAQIGQTTRAVLPEISDLFIELYDPELASLQIVYGIQDGQPIELDTISQSPQVPQELLQSKASPARLAPPSTNNWPITGIEAGNAEGDNAAVANKAAAYVPMAARGEIVGMLHVRSKLLRRFSPIDLEFLTLLANTAAIFIQNAILFENLQQSNRRTQEELAERKQAEATIRRHLSAMETSIDGIAMLDADQAFIYLNAAFATLYGYKKPEQLLGKSWRLLYSENEQQRIDQELIPQLAQNGKWRGEAIGRRLDESQFQQEISLVLAETGEITAVVRDITERRDAEEALQRSQKLESLGVLAGGIAHDFNNFLAGMLGQISLAKAKLPGENPAYRHIEKAITSATRAADLTRQLLAYAGKGNFQVSRVNVNNVIHDNISLLETVVPKQVQLSFELNPTLPNIEADIGQIQQVVMNLIMNAAEAVGDKHGQVTVRSDICTIAEQMNSENHYIGAEKLPPGTYVSLAITDDGAGMDKKVIDRIFDPFFSTKGHGRGLGLSATLGIIRAHKGGLQVESQIGHGSTFRVFLPATIEPVPLDATSSAELELNNLTGTVLVIDDEAAVRESLTEILEIAGLHVLKATNGLEGLEVYKQYRQEISTILLDVHMPVMNGLDTLRELKTIDPKVDVILSSGYSEYSIADHLVNQPTVSFLQKPYSLETVTRRVAERIKLKMNGPASLSQASIYDHLPR
ncbi:MAG: response regulator [Caldilineaceae bacterium]